MKRRIGFKRAGVQFTLSTFPPFSFGGAIGHATTDAELVRALRDMSAQRMRSIISRATAGLK